MVRSSMYFYFDFDVSSCIIINILFLNKKDYYYNLNGLMEWI